MAAALPAESPVDLQFHISPQGDALAASSLVQGNTGDVVLSGSVFGIPYEAHIQVKLEGSTVTVTLTVTKPIPLGPFTWTFNLGGIVRNAANEIVGAASVTLDPSASLMGGPAEAAAVDAEAAAFNFGRVLCILKCGGATVAPTLLACLPSLGGGVPAYVACVTAKLSTGDAAKIAVCVATTCFK
jgi:hypothetical protein